MSDADKGRDLIDHLPNSFISFLIPDHVNDPVVLSFLRELFPDVPEGELEYLTIDDIYAVGYVYDIIGEYLHKFSDELTQQFYAEAASYRTGGPDLPSFLFMDYEGLVQNQWLIHFTNDAEGIASNGFTQGMDDYTRLGLTTYFTDDSKQHGGYNFAYLLSDFMQYGSDRSGEWKYGNECVIFRASGIKVYHHGDGEPQVIFYGNTASDIIPITRGAYSSEEGYEESGWVVPNGYYGSDEIEKVVNWIVDNFAQYRNHLVQASKRIRVTSKQVRIWSNKMRVTASRVAKQVDRSNKELEIRAQISSDVDHNAEVWGEDLSFALASNLSFDLLYETLNEFQEFEEALSKIIGEHDTEIIQSFNTPDPTPELPEGGAATWTLHPASKQLLEDVGALQDSFEMCGLALHNQNTKEVFRLNSPQSNIENME